MHKIRVNANLTYEVNQPTTLLLNVAAAKNLAHQAVDWENLTITPDISRDDMVVGSEKNSITRVCAGPGTVEIEYSAILSLSPITESPPSIDQTDFKFLPPETLPYLNPSRYCEADKLTRFAMAEFGAMVQNFERVTAICDWIYSHIEYCGGTTTSLTTSCDVLLQRTGVCRDFAHLGISFCRALGIPARYVSGYARDLEPADFHGFFEAYLSGRWYLFDPTRMAPTDGLVRIGAGRDAADTPFATIWGHASLLKKTVSAKALTEGPLGQNANDEQAVAVSTA
jgi:transglutaminase-like putative cysteine protease